MNPATPAIPLPDDSRLETLAALALSVFLHLLLILGIAIALFLPTPAVPPPAEEDVPIEMTLVAPPKLAPPQFVRTTVQQDVPEPPKETRFESDNNTRAASEASPSGNEALPSTEGGETVGMELENRNYTDGHVATPPADAARQTEVAPPAVAAPTPMMQLALRQTQPPAVPEAREVPTQQSQPQKAAASQFQPETRVTRLRGNISNRGRASLEASATPLGRYKKMLSDAIGSRWYYYVNDQIGLLDIGTVDIRFLVAADGKARNVRVLSNSSNESFASVSINAILEAEIPPIPEEVAKLLDKGRLEVDYSFTILGN